MHVEHLGPYLLSAGIQIHETFHHFTHSFEHEFVLHERGVIVFLGGCELLAPGTRYLISRAFFSALFSSPLM